MNFSVDFVARILVLLTSYHESNLKVEIELVRFRILFMFKNDPIKNSKNPIKNFKEKYFHSKIYYVNH